MTGNLCVMRPCDAPEAREKAAAQMRGRKHPPDCKHCQAVREYGGRPRTRDLLDYGARHYQVTKARGRAADYICECGQRAAQWATIHGRDGLDPMADYIPMCAKCHDKYDAEAHSTRGRRKKE